MNRTTLFKIVLACAFGATSLFAGAQNVVSGTITDGETTEPLPGVVVSIEGTTKNAISNVEGKYSISAPGNAVLVFSCLGYKEVKEPVNGRSTISVSLPTDATMLDAVVMMGYSSAKKTELSSSVVSMDGDKLRDVTTPDIGNMLQGKVAGVVVYNSSGQPGEAATIRVRGTGSINASADPLYVVDGIPGGSFNPNDVESITVLKDAGATALYGASGAGGVIVITTKKAKKGQDMVIDLKVQGGVKQALSGRFKPMDSDELYSLEKQLYSSVILPYVFPASVTETNFNWMKEAFKLGTTQDYYASVAGSSDKVTYFASLDHYKEKGTLVNTNYGHTTGRINLGFNLTDNLDLNLRANFKDSNDQGTSSYVTLDAAYLMLPYDNPYDEVNGGYLYVNSNIRSDNGGTWYSQDKYNIFHNELYNSSTSRGTELTADLQLIWRITDHISFTTTNQYATSSGLYKLIIDPRTAVAAYPNGYIYQSAGDSKSYATSNLLKYGNTFAGKHNFNALLGYEWSRWRSEYTIAEGSGMSSGLQSLNATTPENVGGYWVDGESWSAFTQLQYSYMEKYIASVSLRADASSVFAPNKRVGYFPSVSAAWIASNESFLKGNPWISFLKFRASYGQTGNSNIDAYKYLDLYAFTSAVSYQGSVGAYPYRQANENLHWERACMTNFGVDVNIKDFLEVNLDLYNIDNNELLLDVPTAPSTGFESITANSGKIRNRGIELQLSSTNIKNKDFSWNTGFNIGLNRNKVISLPNGEDIIQSFGSSSARQIIREGEALYSWYMPKWAGVDSSNGDPLWYKLDGTTTNVLDTENDAQIVGCASPKFSGGLVNTVRWKNWDFSVNLNFVYGNKIFNYTRVIMDADGAYTYYNQMSLNNGLGWSRWEQEGDNATHPRPLLGGNNNANGISSRYLENGSFLRVKNITIGYNLPKKVLTKCKMREAKVFLTADNLYTLTKFSGMDPEVRLESSSYELAGNYAQNYPVGRLFSLGINVKF